MLWVFLACRGPDTEPPPESRAESVESQSESRAESRRESNRESTRESAEPGLQLVWADLHAHSNFSMDGCEADGGCGPRGEVPASDMLANAQSAGLSVVAITDHAEFATWSDGTVEVDIWQRTQELVASAPEGLVVFPGYEWTAHCKSGEGIHRTVVFQGNVPADFRIPACLFSAKKEALGHESYGDNTVEIKSHTSGLYEALAAAPQRWLTFIHHPGLSTPASVTWSEHHDEELLLEIHSEHGSSECKRLEADGCDFGVSQFHFGGGSLQAALQEGQRPGFLAGTDSHDARPGSVQDGPGPSARLFDSDFDGVLDTALPHPYAGGVTGIWVDEVSPKAVFDALLDRRTVAASWPVEVTITADEHMPGRAIPPGVYPLHVEVDAAQYSWELVSQTGTVLESPPYMTLLPGEVYYVRVRFMVDDHEERVWASPWWAEAQ